MKPWADEAEASALATLLIHTKEGQGVARLLGALGPLGRASAEAAAGEWKKGKAAQRARQLLEKLSSLPEGMNALGVLHSKPTGWTLEPAADLLDSAVLTPSPEVPPHAPASMSTQ